MSIFNRPAPAAAPSFPTTRLRRMRHDEFSRRLARENRLSTDDLIYPVFVHDGQAPAQPVPSMPGVERINVDGLLAVAGRCVEEGIPMIALFPVIDPSLKTPDGREALNPAGLVPRAVAAIPSSPLKHSPAKVVAAVVEVERPEQQQRRAATQWARISQSRVRRP